ncbi:nicotinate-nucleotide adenylyltransferase [Amorphus orientalis]|uniref:Probable nicotinate-nucleotide adenylyltransferase n=1 Tax=Amorphus orientalis TaxID=649198 RepID=A0AAE3VM84_9HYPH|nr:nicotinate-nucleotide adenylyltransferase [Amorphus orientalis]MDQ0314627.1 nicotinate-nucleotide adenylyltransferase [Amorphus orientalis]
MTDQVESGANRPDYLRIPPVGIGQRIALFGGTFNPPHKGHRHVALTGLARLGVDQVWWLVTPGNPLKSHDGLTSLEDRVKATRAFADHPRMVVTAFEANYNFRYTADTIAFVCRRFPSVRFVWLMGADNLATLHRWQKWRDILRLVPVAVVDRPGASMAVMSSPASRAFGGARVPESQAAALPGSAPPAWTFLHVPLDPTSSTAMRNQANGGAS